MTQQEQQMLQDLVQKINNTRLQEKDDDAERFLQDGLSRNPDALYMLAQTVLVQNLALEQAKRQLMTAQQQPQPAKATSFLGSLLGHRDPQPPPPPPSGYQPVQYASQAPAYQPPPPGQPSFLRSAASTAAGVAAGAFAFEGIESMLHGGMGGGMLGGGGFGDAPREEIINNYYDDPNQGGSGNDYVAGPDEQPQGPFDNGGQDDASNYGDDSGGFDGGDDTNWS